MRTGLVFGVLSIGLAGLGQGPSVASNDYLAVVAPEVPATSDAWDLETLQQNGRKVADWMLAHPPRATHKDWTYGAFYAGLTAFGLTDPAMPYLDIVRAEGRKFGWALEGRPYHADSHCIGQAWLELALAGDDGAAMRPTRGTFDYILANPSHIPVAQKSFRNWKQNFDRWCWCDALFMAPPVWARLASLTGEDKYRDFMIREYRATAARLYDKNAHLFFRDSRYLDKTAKNGKKVFWSRGCGWVFGGLPLILRELPDGLRSRAYFETIFKEMAAALKNCQRLDGAWSPNLLDSTDPDLQEMSGTSFFCFGLMWGIDHGLLDEAEYLPAVKRAWKAMCRNVSADGKFGWVQPIGDRPVQDFGPDSTEVYAVGAYLLAASEIRAHVVAKNHPEAKTVVVAAGPHFRADTVEVPLKDVNRPTAGLVVWDVRNAAVVPHQLWDGDGDGAVDTLLFPSTFSAGVSRTFKIFNDPRMKGPAVSAVEIPPVESNLVFRCGDRVVKGGASRTRKSLVEGPVRSVCEEAFDPVDCGPGVKVVVRQRLQCDRGSRFVRHAATFEIDGAGNVQGGPSLGGDAAKFGVDLAEGRMVCATAGNRSGLFLCAATHPSVQTVDSDSLQFAQALPSNATLTWYAGRRDWTKGEGLSLADWEAEAERAQECATHPLHVTVK